MKKRILLIPAALMALPSCTQPVSVGEINNLTFNTASKLISFDAVEGADGYHVKLYEDSVLAFDEKILDNFVPMTYLDIAGWIRAEVWAYKGSTQGRGSFVEFNVDCTMDDIVFEAENYLSNFGTGKSGSNFRNNPLAHGGGYVGGIDDCGQGVYIDYLSPVAGTFDFDLYYTMEVTPGYLGVRVNDVPANRFVCTENTGYGGEGQFSAAKSTTQITLVKGWNTISVMKEGTAYENWGSFVEMDYFVLHTKGQTYTKASMATYGEIPPVQRLEGEMASPRHKNEINVFECKNPAIKAHDDKVFSNGWLMGNLDHKYDGLEWQYNSLEAADYSVKVGYATAMSGCKAYFYVTQKEIEMTHSRDFLNKIDEAVVLDLPTISGWDNVVKSEASVTIHLEQDKNFIYLIHMAEDDQSIFQVDYIDIEKITPIED